MTKNGLGPEPHHKFGKPSNRGESTDGKDGRPLLRNGDPLLAALKKFRPGLARCAACGATFFQNKPSHVHCCERCRHVGRLKGDRA